MSKPSTRGPSEEHYCSNTVQLAANVVVYPVSPSPWSPFARNALKTVTDSLKRVADMTTGELRGLIRCALGEYLDSASAEFLASKIPEQDLAEAIRRIKATGSEPAG
jgi:hypothetical protein